jgi:hypothetical protein
MESWKEVLQEAEAHIASCSATDDYAVVRKSAWDFGVSFCATQKRIVNCWMMDIPDNLNYFICPYAKAQCG